MLPLSKCSKDPGKVQVGECQASHTAEAAVLASGTIALQSGAALAGGMIALQLVKDRSRKNHSTYQPNTSTNQAVSGRNYVDLFRPICPFRSHSFDKQGVF